jgi:hypothetical protein
MFSSPREKLCSAALAIVFLIGGKGLTAPIPSATEGAVYAISVELTNRSVTAGGWDAALTRDGTKIAYEKNGFDSDARRYTVLRIYDLASRTYNHVFATTNDFFTTAWNPIFSADGSKLLFTIQTFSNVPPWRAWVHDVITGQTEPAVLNYTNGVPNQYTLHQFISADGSTIVFGSAATDLLAEPLLPFSTRIYARDMKRGVNILVGATPDGTMPNRRLHPADLSPDGRYVLFHSDADNLVPDDVNGSSDLFIFDLVMRTNRIIAEASERDSAVFTKDSGTVIFEAGGIFAYDMASGVIRPLSGGPLLGVSADGRILLVIETVLVEEEEFHTLLWLDTENGTSKRVPAGSYCSYCQPLFETEGWEPRLSGDGRYVFFGSGETNLVEGEFVPGQPNYYRWDSLTGRIVLITPNKFLTGGTADIKLLKGVSTDGSTTVFESSSADLVDSDHYPETDVFVWRAGALPPSLSISVSNGVVRVSWPLTPYESVLEERSGSGPWTPVSSSIQEQNGVRFIDGAVALDSEPHFFRLRPPN